jgi:hypothetical protein
MTNMLWLAAGRDALPASAARSWIGGDKRRRSSSSSAAGGGDAP